MRVVLSCFLHITILAAFGQVLKVDRSHFESDSSGYLVGAIGGNFNVNNRGSTPEEENVYVGVTGNTDFIHVAKNSATIMIGGLTYFKIGDGPTVYNGYVHLREILRRSHTVAPEFLLQSQFDQSRKMEFRQLIGGGLRFNVLRGENSLHAGLGGMFEHEEWRADTTLIVKDLFKINTYVGGELTLNETVTIRTITYFQSGWDARIESFRNRLSSFLQISTELTEHLNFTTSFDFYLDDRPIIPVPRITYESNFGISYTF